MNKIKINKITDESLYHPKNLEFLKNNIGENFLATHGKYLFFLENGFVVYSTDVIVLPVSREELEQVSSTVQNGELTLSSFRKITIDFPEESVLLPATRTPDGKIEIGGQIGEVLKTHIADFNGVKREAILIFAVPYGQS